MEQVSAHKVFGGWLKRYRHHSSTTECDMVFAIFLPPQAEQASVPAVYWLSGLTCTDENFCQKAGAFRVAAELGLAIICPDTSPRGCHLPGEDDSYDLGTGAGFYLNATQQPWRDHYRMYDYVAVELPALVEQHFPLDGQRAISGHSMGGHGALVIGLRNPDAYRAITAFAPISNPMNCPWGIKAFQHYLGADRQSWKTYDASELIARCNQPLPLLVDQGSDDEFLDEQLHPKVLQQVCEQTGYPLTFRLQRGYDHSYFFIASFIENHLRFHARHMRS